MTRSFLDTGWFEPVFAVEMDEDAAAGKTSFLHALGIISIG